MNKISISIAIPAYNEEKNIVSLLESIKKQKAENYKIEGIFVYSDGSKDNTVKLVRENFKDIKVFDFKKNRGKNVRVNQMFRNNKSDVFIQVDADIHIKDNNVIENLIKPFYLNKGLGISCAYQLSDKPNTFVGRLSYFGFKVWDDARSSLGTKAIRYYCEGGLRAFSKDFTKIFQLPLGKHIGEDTYSFYFAVSHGFKVKVCKDSKFYQDLPKNYKDYAKQMKRFLHDPQMVVEEFNKDLTRKYEDITIEVKLCAFAAKWLENPLVGTFYIFLQLAVYIENIFYKPTAKWSIIERN